MGIENKVLSLVRKFGTSNPYKIAKKLDINLLEANLGEVKAATLRLEELNLSLLIRLISKWKTIHPGSWVRAC